MNTKIIHGLLLMIVVMMAGCSKPQTQVDNFYGTSYELAKQSQFYNPNAGKEPQLIEGLDGKVGKHVMERYEAGFAKPAPKGESYSVTFEGMTKK